MGEVLTLEEIEEVSCDRLIYMHVKCVGCSA